MRRLLPTFSLAVVLLAGSAAPAAADNGCARALAATAGTPGHAFVAAHCASPDTSPTTSPTGPAGPAAAVQGCAVGVAASAGTPGAPFVQAACSRLAEQLGVPAPAPVNVPTSDSGCAIAELMTRGTSGHVWVVATCGGASDTSAVGERAAAEGCARAIEAVVGTVAEPFVRAGCAQAVVSTGDAAMDDQSTPVDQDSQTDETAGP